MSVTFVYLASKMRLVHTTTLVVALLAYPLGRASWRAAADAPVLTPEQTRASYKLPPGYRLELVAAEPLVQDPVAVDFDADGRMYVVEMRGFMPNIDGKGEDRPVGRIVVLTDTDNDGKMDKKTVFLDSLVLPRAIKVLEHGVLIAAPPNLWLVRDTTGDLKADTKKLIRSDYGDPKGNPEHNANGLVWGIDNWIHNSNYAGEFRVRGDRIEYRATPSQGQWGLSMDSYGRLYRNSNEDPLHVDLIPEHYATRNPSFTNMRGLYEALTPNSDVFPAHATPAVNRGYQPQILRADTTLVHYTSASSPTAYVGDRLPAELLSSVFVTEPAGNLVGRFVVREDSAGMLSGTTGPERPSFLASTDVRSRPVSLTTAPDGTLYVVDMYRGIIQHRTFITGYLEEQIKKIGLEQPVGLGRIYRLVHSTTKRGPRPNLSRATTSELVQTLAHPNGWWRITAQRLLVERGDSAALPALRQLARSAPSDVTRLHALWTIDGLEAADVATLTPALHDASPQVRAAAVRIAEPLLRQADTSTTSEVMRLVTDGAPVVRRQLAASLGELPAGAREGALAALVARSGSDPIVADLVVTALPKREFDFLERTLASSAGASSGPAATIQALSAAVLRTRDTASVSRVLALTTDEARPRWQRLALLDGLVPPASRFGGFVIPSDAAPAPGRGGGGRGGRGGGGPTLSLAATPTALLAMAGSEDTALATRARRISGTLDWPGKPRPPAPETRALTADEQRRFAEGQKVFTAICAGCHQPNGEGREGVAKSLVGSQWALAPAPQVTRIVLHGKEGQMLMPPVGGSMTDEQIAAVLTYVRRSWGNTAVPISPAEVQEARGASMGRKKAWTEAELSVIRR